MKTVNQLNELNILIQSRIPLLQIETTEEVRLLKFLELTALEKNGIVIYGLSHWA